MALIDALGREFADPFVHAPEEGSLPAGQSAAGGPPIIFPWVRAADQPPAALGPGFGLLIPADLDLVVLAPFLPAAALIVIAFKKFNDGRGFTAARRLRGEYAYSGGLRAAGWIIPDQFAALLACGFDSIDTPPAHPPQQWQRPDTGAPRQLLQRMIGR